MTNRNLLAVPVGIKQKGNVDAMVKKVLYMFFWVDPKLILGIEELLGFICKVFFVSSQFRPANFTVVLFHYDGNMDKWWDLEWSSKAIHIVAQNQTKWYLSFLFQCITLRQCFVYMFHLCNIGLLYVSFSWFSGGLQNDFSIRTLYPFMIMFFFGMRILELRTSHQRGKFQFHFENLIVRFMKIECDTNHFSEGIWR